MMKKGFITIAYGDYYITLAQNLLLSYRFSVPSSKQLPFSVITNKVDDERLNDFDEKIFAEPAQKGFMNKLLIDKYVPYDETIFIDADCLVYKDISKWFLDYEQNGSPFSSFGRNIELRNVDSINNILFDYKLAAKKYPLIQWVPHFNAATYFLNKNGGQLICQTALNIYLSLNYSCTSGTASANGCA